VSARITATLRAERDRLLVAYRAANTGDAPLWLLDDMVVLDSQDRLQRTPAAIIVVESEDPDVVRFARGLVNPRSFVAFPLIPGARRVEPGGSLEGSAVVPLPLQAFHPQDGSRSLASEPARAVVEIGVIEDPRAAFESWPLAEGGELRLPTPRSALRHQRMARSDVLPLPRREADDEI
jgi:hypothetical protein